MPRSSSSNICNIIIAIILITLKAKNIAKSGYSKQVNPFDMAILTMIMSYLFIRNVIEHHCRLILKLIDQYKVYCGRERFIISLLNKIQSKNGQ